MHTMNGHLLDRKIKVDGKRCWRPPTKRRLSVSDGAHGAPRSHTTTDFIRKVQHCSAPSRPGPRREGGFSSRLAGCHPAILIGFVYEKHRHGRGEITEDKTSRRAVQGIVVWSGQETLYTGTVERLLGWYAHRALQKCVIYFVGQGSGPGWGVLE